MTNKATKYGLMTIAAVLLVAMAFAGAASADGIAPEQAVSYQVTVLLDDGTEDTKTLASTYLIKNESNWKYIVNDVNTKKESLYKSANLSLIQDVLFTYEVASLGTKNGDGWTGFNGSIYGNGYKFINFTQSTALDKSAHGLIYYATDGCILNYVQMIDCDISTNQQHVGGVIGYATSANTDGVKLCGCSVTLSNVTTSQNIGGGLVGFVQDSKLWINASQVKRTYVLANTSAAGGLVGHFPSGNLWINGSTVEDCEIMMYQGHYVGGLVAFAEVGCTLTNSTVTNCKLRSVIPVPPQNSYASMGGLVGKATASTILDGCTVEKCTLNAPDDYMVGGLIGWSNNVNIISERTTWVNSTWISGKALLGSLIGNGAVGSVTGNQPVHNMVYNGTADALNPGTYNFDNTFDGTAASAPEGIGSQIGKTLFAGKDYGYGSAKHVTYVANGATSGVAPSKQTYAPGSTVTVADQGDLAKIGYTFRGWYNESTGLLIPGTTYDSFTISEDVTLYAQWVSGTIYSGGSGTETDPYIIATTLDFYNLTQNILDWQNPAGVYFKLGNDIYISDIQSITKDPVTHIATISNSTESMEYNWTAKSFDRSAWNPGFNETVASFGLSTWPTIGNSTLGVTGKITLDGNNFNIYGLFINDTIGTTTGLFGYISSTGSVKIANLGLVNSFVYSESSMGTGSLVGYARYSETCTFERCTLTDSIVSSKGKPVGGFIGECEDMLKMTIDSCEVSNCVISSNGNCPGGLSGDGVRNSGTIKKCTVSNSIIETIIGMGSGSGCHAGGLCGSLGRNADESLDALIEDCKVIGCSIKNGNVNAGGLVGLLRGSLVNNCSVVDCTINGSNMRNGGLVGYVNTKTSAGNECVIMNSYVMNSNVSGRISIGGIVGQNDGLLKLYNCTVSCSNVTGCHNSGSDDAYTGGLIGSASNVTTISYCNVLDCENISGEKQIGGVIGHAGGYEISVNYTVVKNSNLLCTGELSSSNHIGGFVGTTMHADSKLDNNTLENILIKGIGTGDTRYAYLFDISKYPINSSNGTAKLGQITLENDNKIINGYVFNSSLGQINTKFDGFANLTTGFAITVSNPSIGIIYEDAFKDTNLTGLSNLSSTVTICANAFNGSKLTGGFYIPLTATIDPYAFNGTDNLQIIYANTIDGLTGLNESIALVDITSIGTLGEIQPGSFSIASENKFETVTLGSNTANKFKNLSDGTYLTANGPWVPGSSYLAEYEYIPPAYTPSSSKQTGSTVILEEGQTAPTAYATVAPTVAPTVKPTEQPATPTVIATEKPTTQATQQSPAPFVGLLAGLGAAAVLLRLRK